MRDQTPDTVPAEGVSKAKFDATRAARVSIVLVPLGLWIWLCRDWPARLGFYSDDWMVMLHPSVGTAGAFRDILTLTATRPMSAPYIWLAQVIADWSPARSQMLNAAMLLLSAASIGVLAAALLAAAWGSVVRGLRCGLLVAGCVASSTFLVFPSNVGTFAWGTGVSTVVPALPLFCLSVSLLLHSENSWQRLFLGLALALLSHLSYEAFYFQEIVFVLLAMTLRGDSARDVPWRVLIGVVIVNLACVAFNRLTPGGIQKSFHRDFLQIFVVGYSHLLNMVGHAVREHWLLIAGTVLVAGSSGTFCLVRLVGASRAVLALLLTICGMVAAGFLYAFAGYGLATEGTMARVSIVIATYYAIVSGILAAAAWWVLAQSRLPTIAFCLSVVAGLVALELTARARVADWASSWSYESARLSRLRPTIASADIAAGGGQRIYLAVDDGPALFIEPATAPWEIVGAVAWTTYQITHSCALMAGPWKRAEPRWFATPRSWFNRWDGHTFAQGPCGSGTVYGASGTEFWIWTTSVGTLIKVDAPWENGCP